MASALRQLATTDSAARSMLLYEAAPFLSGSPDLLEALAPDAVRRIERAGHPHSFTAGEMLFRQGEPHRGVFILRSGLVRSHYLAPSGRQITLATWPGGHLVGGPDVFGDGPHVWSGTAIEPGQAIRLPGPVVRALIANIPAFAVTLMEALAVKGKCYSALLQVLGTRSVLERLALVLLNLAQNAGKYEAGFITFPAPTHEELAAAVGATRQWVSMTIKRFRNQGLLATRERRIVLLAEAKLRALADGDVA